MATSDESLKGLSGKIKLERRQIFRATLFLLVCAAIVSIAATLKFALVDKLSFSKPVLSYVMIIVGIFAFFVAFDIYIAFSRKWLIVSLKNLHAIGSAVVISVILCLYLSIISVVLMPTYAAAFIIAPIAKKRDAFLGNILSNILILFCMLIAYEAGHDISIYEVLAVFIVGIASGSIAAYTVSNDAKRFSYILMGLLISTISFGFIIFFIYTNSKATDHFANSLAFAAGGVYMPMLLGLVLQPILEIVFNLVTNSRLVELTDHNSPLIKRLRTETPGTFNHSLAVANFAEICASAIGENPYLARACAYYHDVGKLVNSEYFKENQSETNPHDELLPEVSADIIRGHTTEGLKLCRQYRIPYEVAHVTIQHHGTLLIPVFYNKAKQLTDTPVDPVEYSYRGQTPVTKVAAIIMLCDVGEAAIRAMDAPDGEKVDKLLSELIGQRISAGQFDNCDISLRDLDTIKETIISAYGGLFHKRMKYPEGDSNEHDRFKKIRLRGRK